MLRAYLHICANRLERNSKHLPYEPDLQHTSPEKHATCASKTPYLHSASIRVTVAEPPTIHHMVWTCTCVWFCRKVSFEHRHLGVWEIAVSCKAVVSFVPCVQPKQSLISQFQNMIGPCDQNLPPSRTVLPSFRPQSRDDTNTCPRARVTKSHKYVSDT